MVTEPACDPIAIAALIAELPELEADYIQKLGDAEIARQKLDAHQKRIDAAMGALRKKAPKNSNWDNSNWDNYGKENFIIDALAKCIESLQQRAAYAGNGFSVVGQAPPSLGLGHIQPAQPLTPPPPPLSEPWPAIKKGGPWG